MQIIEQIKSYPIRIILYLDHALPATPVAGNPDLNQPILTEVVISLTSALFQTLLPS